MPRKQTEKPAPAPVHAGSRIDWKRSGWQVFDAGHPVGSQPAAYVIQSDIELPGPVRLELTEDLRHGWLVLPGMSPEELATYLGLENVEQEQEP